MALTPLDFPASPTDGQTYPNPPVTGQPTYQWDAATGVWLSKFALGEEYVQLDGGQPMTGLLTLSGNPTAPMHAATKSYVDSTEKGRKNYIINGAMQISQENGATVGTTNSYYPCDMFASAFSYGGVASYAQVASYTPGGSPARLRVTVTTADAAVAAGDFAFIAHTIEGARMADLRAGSAVAKTITIQFGIKAPAGTYCIALRNGAGNRVYVAEYVIAAGEANTDVMKSVTINLDTTGTWVADNTAGMYLSWTLMAGLTYQLPAGVWQAGNVFASSNQFNFMGTAGNVFELFDVSLTEGTVAPPFQVPDYASELELCQRYYQKYTNGLIFGAVAGTCSTDWLYVTTMRSAPTFAIANTTYTNASALSCPASYVNHARLQITTTAAGIANSDMIFLARL